MKKLLTVLFALVLVFVYMAPQANAQGLTAKGVVAGLNMAKVAGDDVDFGTIEPSNRMGFAAGVFLNVSLNDNLAFRPEVLYSQHGAKYEQGGNSIILKVDAIDIPLLFQYTFSMDGSISPFILVGPYAAYILSAKIGYDITGMDLDDEDVKDTIKDLDFGVMFGIGALISGQFELSARYQMGLITLDDTDTEADMKNATIQIIAGFRF